MSTTTSRQSSRRGSACDAAAEQTHHSRSSSFTGASGRRSHAKLSSADFVITVSPGASTQRYLPPGQPEEGDVEAGDGVPPLQPQQQQPSSRRVGVAQLLPGQQQARDQGLLEPLLPPVQPQQPQKQQQQQQQQQHEPPAPAAEFDPFPATTAARAAAAEVARCRAAAAPVDDLRAALLGRSASAAAAAVAGRAEAASKLEKQLSFASGLSWAVNILLLVAKLYAFYCSSSKAVLASAADSAVDLVSQIVIAYTAYRTRTSDPRFPVGQARLEAIGVLACACIMSVASFEVIQESISALVAAYTTGQLPVLDLGLVMYVVLGAATLLKCVCWAVCAALQAKSDSMLALAEDHLNDVMSNTVAILAAAAAGFVTNGWWIDPAGAIVISLYIVSRWIAIAKEQVDKIVGKGAPPEFVEQLQALANAHHSECCLDVMRAYHFGSRFIVELEVVMPAEMSVKDSHDVALDLQHKVEQLEEVERAFVHVDYMRRDGLEHKVERELAIARALSTSSSGRITPGLDTSSGGGGSALASRDGA